MSSGATAIEYGLIAALVSVAAIAALGQMGTSLRAIFGVVSTELNKAVELGWRRLVIAERPLAGRRSAPPPSFRCGGGDVRFGGMAQFALVATLCALLIWAAASDMQRYLIPNRICLSLLVLYPGYAVGLTPAEIGIAAAIAASVFVGRRRALLFRHHGRR